MKYSNRKRAKKQKFDKFEKKSLKLFEILVTIATPLLVLN